MDHHTYPSIEESWRPGDRRGVDWGRVCLALAAIVLLGAGLGGCDEDGPQTLQESEPPSLPEPAEPEPTESAQAPSPQPSQPAEPQAAPGQPTGAATPSQGAPGATDTDPISDDELQSFAKVQMELGAFQQKLAQKAKQGADQTQLRSQLQQRAAQVVEESDLSMERYDEIARKYQKDAELQQRLRAIMKEKAGG